MKAGAALGLLAGLGALNAIRGGREGTGKRFTGLMDMLDGGGAGASGDRFEGGGLLSILGNLFAKPLEAQNNVERIAADTNATKAVTEVLKQAITPEQRTSAAMAEMNRQRGLLQDQFDLRDMQGASGFRNPMADYPDISMPAIEGYTTPSSAGAASDYPNMSMSAIEGYSTPAPTQDSPAGLLGGNQAVPAMTNYNPTVPSLARSIAASDKVSPVFSQDYADYLEYLMTGRYPRG
jgi:hypothetical protein